MEIFKIILLSTVSFAVLFALTKLMGYRQISQLSFFDYVISISIGSIAAEMSTNVDMQWWKGTLAMVIYTLLTILFEFITRKSIKAKGLIDGKPIILMHDGNIDKKALKKAKVEVNDLISAAREQGIFNIADIDCAIMEITGKISFMPKPLSRALNPKDFNFAPIRTGLCTTLVIDGKIIPQNLKKADISASKLRAIIAQRQIDINNVLLATMDETGRIEIFESDC